MLSFAIKHMLTRKGKVLCACLSVALSACVALLAVNVSTQVRQGIVTTAGYYDVIIGPSGSATQLAMNTMFFTDTPLGTIPYQVYEDLQSDPHVRAAVPFTMGDSFNGAPIVGTTPDLLSDKELAEGEMFADTFEAVVGAQVARAYGLEVGQQIITSHGLAGQGASHEASPFTVVGILKTTGTNYDNAVFTSVQSVRAVHEYAQEDEEEHAQEEHTQEGEICAVLVRTGSFNDYYALTEAYSQDSSLLVINPASVLREVLDNVDFSSRIVYILSLIILLMNLLVVVVIALLNLYDARQEIALMRLIGIGMGRVRRLFILESCLTGLVGVLLALLGSMLGLHLAGGLAASMGVVLNAWIVYPSQWAILAAVFLISLVPTVVLAGTMARRDVLR